LCSEYFKIVENIAANAETIIGMEKFKQTERSFSMASLCLQQTGLMRQPVGITFQRLVFDQSAPNNPNNFLKPHKR